MPCGGQEGHEAWHRDQITHVSVVVYTGIRVRNFRLVDIACIFQVGLKSSEGPSAQAALSCKVAENNANFFYSLS